MRSLQKLTFLNVRNAEG